MKKWSWLVALPLMALLLARPEAAVNGAREAMAKWYYAVAPSLFPFMALLPLLTGPEAADCAEAALGGIMRAAFGLPGAAAPALVIGLVGGSPGGCLAARRIDGLTRAQLERLAAACSGLSPAFLISGVGASMLASPALGHVLLRSQLLSQLAVLCLLRALPDDGRIAPAAPPREESGLARAVGAILNVAGYMTLFGALAAAVGPVGPALCALDVSSGALTLSALKLPIYERMLLLSALIGFSGVCVIAQNLAALKGSGTRPARFVAIKLAAAALAAAFTALQTRFNAFPKTFTQIQPMHFSALFALCIAIPALFRLKNIVLNTFNIEITIENGVENTPNRSKNNNIWYRHGCTDTIYAGINSFKKTIDKRPVFCYNNLCVERENKTKVRKQDAPNLENDTEKRAFKETAKTGREAASGELEWKQSDSKS